MSGRDERVIPGKMFQDLPAEYQDFFEYGPGAMCWSKDLEGRRVLIFIVPPLRVVRVYTDTDEHNWCTPGPISRWDGNEARPTLKPSIQLKEWHGYVKEGNLWTV